MTERHRIGAQSQSDDKNKNSHVNENNSDISDDESMPFIEKKAKEKNKKTLKNDYVKLFGVDLSRLPEWAIASLLLAIVMVGFLLIGLVEEGFKVSFPTFNFGWFMTAIELYIFSIFAALERLLQQAHTVHLNALPVSLPLPNTSSSASSSSPPLNDENHENPHPQSDDLVARRRLRGSLIGASSSYMSVVIERKVEMKWHILVAGAMTASRGLTNIALLYLNYPTQVVFKSMKLISVMIGSILFLKKKYTYWEYLAAPLMVGAAMSFSLGDTEQALQFNLTGTVAVVISLIFDSIHANSQEKVLKLHRNTALELLVYSNFFSAVFASIVAILTGELLPLIEFFYLTSFFDVLAWFVIRVLCLYMGVSALIVLTKRYGAVAAVTVTTVRKVVTVLLSYVIWPNEKAFAKPHAMGTVFFIVSLVLNGAGVHQKNQTG